MPVSWSGILPNRVLGHITTAEFVENAKDLGSQLQVSHDPSFVCNLIREKHSSVTPLCVLVDGEPGSGRTSFIQCICQKLISESFVNESGILYIDVKRGCDQSTLHSLISTIARERQDTGTASLLQQASVEQPSKDEAIQLFVKDNFNLICIDRSGYHDAGVISDLLSILGAGEVSIPIIAVSTQNVGSQLQEGVNMEAVRISGMKEQYSKELLSATGLQFSDMEAARIFSCLSGNPVAIRLFLQYCAEFCLSKQDAAQTADMFDESHQNGQVRGAVNRVFGIILS